jgi:hypothetical protein
MIHSFLNMYYTKCEKLTDGRLPMTKAHMAYSQVELKITVFNYFRNTMKNLKAIYVE